MFIEAILTATAIAAISMVGVLFFGDKEHPTHLQRFAIPTAVGVFLSLVLFELIPETLLANPEGGGFIVALGFIAFYFLSFELHRYFHRKDESDCERKGAAALLLVGDAVHNLADGVILGTAFLIDPAVGVAVGVGLALHELPQEIVEFAIFMRAGYTRSQALFRNFISASSIVVGTALTITLASHAEEKLWVITGLAAGNLLYLAATDLLPRAHSDLKRYGGFRYTLVALIAGFLVMTAMIDWTHEKYGHGHEHDGHDEELHDEHEEDGDLNEHDADGNHDEGVPDEHEEHQS